MHKWFIKDDSCRNKSERQEAPGRTGVEGEGRLATQRHNTELTTIRCTSMGLFEKNY